MMGVILICNGVAYLIAFPSLFELYQGDEEDALFAHNVCNGEAY